MERRARTSGGRRGADRPVVAIGLAAAVVAIAGIVAAPAAADDTTPPSPQAASTTSWATSGADGRFRSGPGGAAYALVDDPRARLPYPYSMVTGPDGRPWFYHSALFSIASDGTVIAHPTSDGHPIDSRPLLTADGALWAMERQRAIRFGADGVARTVATVSSVIDWTVSSDNRLVAVSWDTRNGYRVSWVDADGGVVSTPRPGTEDWFSQVLAAGPSGSVWTRQAGGYVGLFPDGRLIPLALPAGTAGVALSVVPGSPLHAVYNLDGKRVLATVEPDGTTSPIAVDATWYQLIGDDVIWASPSTTGADVVHRLKDPSWSVTMPAPTSMIAGTCWQPATDSLWVGTRDRPGDGRARLYQVSPTGTQVRLESITPYSIGWCKIAPDGSLWSNGTIAYLHVSADASSIAYDAFTQGSSGPTVVSSDGDLWAAVSVDDPSPDAAIGHLRYLHADRTAGADRFDSAAMVATAAFPAGAATVYLASGRDFPDALAAGPAAAHDGGPLLLTERDVLPAATASSLTRLKPSRVVVVGGTTAVTTSVERAVRSLLPGATVDRLSGPDRLATGREVVSSAFSTASHVYVATGLAFPDALSASAAAGAEDAPVVLVDGGASTLDADTRALLEGLDPSTITVVGGPSAVSDGLLSELNRIATTTRAAGDERFATAAAVARTAFPDAHRAFLANGFTFPDALTGAVWAAATKSPLLTVTGDCVPAPTMSAMLDTGVQSATLLGGTAILSPRLDALSPCATG